MRSDRKSTRLNSSHSQISYAVFCLKKKKKDSARSDRYVSRTLLTACWPSRGVAFFNVLHLSPLLASCTPDYTPGDRSGSTCCHQISTRAYIEHSTVFVIVSTFNALIVLELSRQI